MTYFKFCTIEHFSVFWFETFFIFPLLLMSKNVFQRHLFSWPGVGIVGNFASTQHPSVPKNFFWPVPGTRRYPKHFSGWYPVQSGTQFLKFPRYPVPSGTDRLKFSRYPIPSGIKFLNFTRYPVPSGTQLLKFPRYPAVPTVWNFLGTQDF